LKLIRVLVVGLFLAQLILVMPVPRELPLSNGKEGAFVVYGWYQKAGKEVYSIFQGLLPSMHSGLLLGLLLRVLCKFRRVWMQPGSVLS